MRPATLIKKRLWYRHFPVNFVKFLRTPLVAASQYGQITALHEKMSERIIFDECHFTSVGRLEPVPLQILCFNKMFTLKLS